MDIAPAGFLPVTVVGWLTVIGLLATLIVQLVQMGRFLQKLEDIREDFGEFKDTVGIMDTHLASLSQGLRELIVEWRGADGTNGGRSRIRNLEKWKETVEARHIAEDAVTRIEREQGHGKRRRLRDRLIDENPKE